MGDLDPHTLLHRRYVIMRTIGQGSMAAVYQANDTRRGTLVAIKEMSLSTVPANERPQAIQNFLAEARILSRLNHPNLPAFTDFFTEGARHFLVMDYIDGDTLEDLLERNNGPFSEIRVLGWARQLCDVLEYLHNQQPPVIFRDIRPGNVMLTRSGRITLIDFGIARLFRHSGSQDTQLLGTSGFAPPEQYGGAQTDVRSDIYSLAISLFRLLTNTIIFKNGFGLTNVHANFPHISSPVARALEKATSLRPEDRYESIIVFRRALLGVGSFRFESGGEATTPEELAELCAHYPTEAADYLFAGEIESWLTEIGENDLARTTKRIRATVGDSEMGVNKFLQAVMGPSAHIRKQKSDTTVIVRPKAIDFGEVHPGLSAPFLLTISGVKGALVSGTIHPVESWIVLDQTTFDGMSTPIRVRADSTRLRGSTHYTGTIIVTPDNSEQEIAVIVESEVLSYKVQSPPLRAKVSANPPSGTLEQQGQKTNLANKKMKVFFSYAPEDKELCDRLVIHLSMLKRQRRITAWLARDISAGKESAQEVDNNLNTADIILLLVSSDFIASDYCYGFEMQQALKRHDKGEARVIPVILRQCDWEHAPFSKLHVLPTDGWPVVGAYWHDPDEAFSDIAKGIRKVVNELLASL